MSWDDMAVCRDAGSAAEKEVPAAHKQVPAQPEPEREERPPARRVAHDRPEGGTQRRHAAADMAQREALPGENGPDEDRPDQVTEHGMITHLDLQVTRQGMRKLTLCPNPAGR